MEFVALKKYGSYSSTLDFNIPEESISILKRDACEQLAGSLASSCTAPLLDE